MIQLRVGDDASVRPFSPLIQSPVNTMTEHFDIRIIGRSGKHLGLLEDVLLSSSELQIKRKLIIDLAPQVLAESQGVDVVILDLSEDWKNELQQLARLRRSSDIAPTIVIGVEDNIEMLKMAMKAGARDFYAHPIPSTELVESTLQICREAKTSEITETNLSVVTNGKGGAGASFFASNIAHILASERRRESTMLLDLNLAAGELPLYFDLSGGNDLRQALEYIDNIDDMALKGFTMCHKSGVHLMASSGEATETSYDINSVNLDALISIIKSNYKQLIIDLPNPNEPFVTELLQTANQVFVVIQQNLIDIHCTKHLLATPPFSELNRKNITLVVNRFETRNPVRYQDIKASFNELEIQCIPNDYKRVSESINTGVPLAERWKKAPVTCAVRELACQILGVEKKPTNVLDNFWKALSAKNK